MQGSPSHDVGEHHRAPGRLAGAPCRDRGPDRGRQEVHRRRRCGPRGPGGLLGLLLGLLAAAGVRVDSWLRVPERSLLPEAGSRLHATTDARDRSADQRSRRVAHGQQRGARGRARRCSVERTRRHPGDWQRARSPLGGATAGSTRVRQIQAAGTARARLARSDHGRLRPRRSGSRARARSHRRSQRCSASQRRPASTLPCSSRRSGCSRRPR